MQQVEGNVKFSLLKNYNYSREIESLLLVCKNKHTLK